MSPFPDLTGEKLLMQVSRHAHKQIVRKVLLLILFAAIIIGANAAMVMDFRNNFFILFFLPLWILLIYYPIQDIKKHQLEILQGENNDIFLLYGSPDEIAEILSDPTNEQLLESKKVVLTRSYLVMKDDLLTFVPIDRLSRISVMHHSSRNSRYVYLDVCTTDKRILKYQFEDDPLFGSAAKRTNQIAEIITALMQSCAPECHVYSQYQ